MGLLTVGLMSGTSLDGIDASLVRINGSGRATRVEVLESLSLTYDDRLKEELLRVMDVEASNVAQICSLNFKLSYLFADAVKQVCTKAGIPLKELDLIGSHGQTVYHMPKAPPPYVDSTLQIGDPSVIAYETGTIVVSNFRTMDMAAGGEGAPLIPYIDWLLFTDTEKGRILQNIGGIGNCTVLEKNAPLDRVYAFDTGPGNMIIDELCRSLFNLPYDKDGKIAATGKVHEELVIEWMNEGYFQQEPPKSTGRELFGKEYGEKIITSNPHLPKEDLVATATYFTAYSIVDAYKTFVFPKVDIGEIIVSGGGGNNSTMVQMMQELLPDKDVFTIDRIGMTTDEKEAVGFAILANETIHQQSANVPHATGAKESVILGQITLPPEGDQRQILKQAGLM